MMISAVLVCNFYTQIIKEVTWINLFQAKGQTQASGESEVAQSCPTLCDPHGL